MLVLYGATTGRDGIGGASVLASQELGEGAAEKRPSVQIGDPFTGNRLIEVSLELVERGLVDSLQDCGAAGLASALAEMARDGAGVDVHLDRVPLREPDLEAWEIMISESQERMVAAVAPERLREVAEVLERWELPFAEIGVVTESGELRAAGRRRGRRGDPGPLAHGRVPPLRGRAEAGAAEERRAVGPGEPGPEDADLRALRPPRRLSHGAPARARRRRAAALRDCAGWRSRSTALRRASATPSGPAASPSTARR